jgi:3-methyladenine DNA glycosylase Tag
MSTWYLVSSCSSYWYAWSCRAGFDNFDPALVAKYDEEKIATLKSDSSILIPETKMRGAVENARRVLEVKKS